MYESLQQVREVMLTRLEEIDRELAQYETLVREREMLRRTLRQPPFVEEPVSAPEENGAERRRARRGENIQRVLEFVQAHPDATVSEIAEGTGIRKPVVHNTVRTLRASGRLERVELISGLNGYRAPESAAAA